MPQTRDIIQFAQQEEGVSKHLHLSHLNSATVAENTQGMLLSVIKLEGHAFDTTDVNTLNKLTRIWQNCLATLDSSFCVYGTIHRRSHFLELPGKFNNKYLQEVDDKYQYQFKKKHNYVNDIYLTIVYRGISINKKGKKSKLFKYLRGTVLRQARAELRVQQLEKLQSTCTRFMSVLQDFKPRLLGKHDTKVGHSELLEFFSIFVNAGRKIKFKNQVMPAINNKFKPINQQLYPQGRISQYISKYRILFGKYIQFQGDNDADIKYAVMLGIKQYGNASCNIMLDNMLQLPGEYIATHSFAVLAKELAQKNVQRNIVRKNVSGDYAVNEASDLHKLQEKLQADQLTVGLHHNSIMLVADSISICEKLTAQVIKNYLQSGIVVVRETIGLEASFWGQVPGAMQYAARSTMISSANFCDFFPLHNYKIGNFQENYLGGAMTLAQTPAQTLMYFNLHALGPKDNPTAGHTIMIGGNGSGKTVAMCFCDAQLSRYGGRSVFFDRDCGMLLYVKACGGYYAIISPAQHETVKFNPLALSNTAANRSFIKLWLQHLVLNPGEIACDAESGAALSAAVDYVFNAIPHQSRTLAKLAEFLAVDFPRHAQLNKFIRGRDGAPDGEYAYLYDNTNDSLDFSTANNKIAFDMTHFLDNEPPHILSALSMYLFYRIESELDGSLTSIFMDEGWQYLENYYWSKKLKSWLPTLRKLNCQIILATQSPASVAASSIAHIIRDNCATQIYFANPLAQQKQYIDAFKLTSSEYDCVKNLDPKQRYFVYKQAQGSCLCKFPLQNLPEVLKVFSATKQSVNLALKLIQQYPHNWLKHFLNKVDADV